MIDVLASTDAIALLTPVINALGAPAGRTYFDIREWKMGLAPHGVNGGRDFLAQVVVLCVLHDSYNLDGIAQGVAGADAEPPAHRTGSAEDCFAMVWLTMATAGDAGVSWPLKSRPATSAVPMVAKYPSLTALKNTCEASCEGPAPPSIARSWMRLPRSIGVKSERLADCTPGVARMLSRI